MTRGERLKVKTRYHHGVKLSAQGLRTARARSWLSCLLGLTFLFTFAADSEARRPAKKPTETTTQPPLQDPMEVENSTPPPVDPNPQPPPQPNSGQSHPAQNDPKGTDAPRPTDKAGRFMANLKIGPAICLYNCDHQGAIVIELGWSVLPDRNTYLVLPIQFHFSPTSSAVIIPLGFQYDIGVPRVPGLYFYPRISIGYALLINNASPGSPLSHAGVVIPEFGFKYIIATRWNIGADLVSIPIIFGQDATTGTFAHINYRILLSAGVTF